MWFHRLFGIQPNKIGLKIERLLGGKDPTPELLNDVKKDPAEVLFTLNGVEWIPIGSFTYFGKKRNI